MADFRTTEEDKQTRYDVQDPASTRGYRPRIVTSDLVTAEPEVNIGSSRRDPTMTLSETPSSKEQYENVTTYQTPQLGPAP